MLGTDSPRARYTPGGNCRTQDWFDPDINALTARIREQNDIEDAIVVVGLHGERHAGAKLRRDDFTPHLSAAYLVEVYDDREVPPAER